MSQIWAYSEEKLRYYVPPWPYLKSCRENSFGQEKLGNGLIKIVIPINVNYYYEF